LLRIEEEGKPWQPAPPGISGRGLQERMKKRDGDRLLMVLAFMASISWVFLGGFVIAITFEVSLWLTFALSTVVYSMLLSVLYMIVVLDKRRKSKEVLY
ncbi:MAG TPA: hypothetical protein VLN47_02525, partial [Clostridiaceae bacterium]|nr:hypothetical protein [Clostridiaceae bacterium]